MTFALVVPLDPDVIARIRDGDESAFKHLFDRYYRPLCVYAGSIDRSEGAAEEIVQDVFFRIWVHRDRLNPVQSLSGYLFTAVRNRAYNRSARLHSEQAYRSRLLDELQDAPHQGAAADEEVRAAEIAAAVDRAIAQLPPRCREAFLLRRQQRLSCADIARAMQISPKTVEIQITKALKALRVALAEWL